MINITLEELLEAGAHFGHHVKRWNPKMDPFIYGVSDGVHVFDLAKTKEALEEALEIITKAVKEGKVLLLVGTKKQAREKVKEVAEKTNIAYIGERFLGGTFTNFSQITRSVKKLAELEEKMAKGEFASYTKKERLLINREIERLKRMFGGIAKMQSLPDLVIIIDTHHEKGVVHEAKKMGIETIGIVDTNANPDEVTHAIPMNDDASSAIEFVMERIKQAILEGKNSTVAKTKTSKKTKVIKKEKPKQKKK